MKLVELIKKENYYIICACYNRRTEYFFIHSDVDHCSTEITTKHAEDYRNIECTNFQTFTKNPAPISILCKYHFSEEDISDFLIFCQEKGIEMDLTFLNKFEVKFMYNKVYLLSFFDKEILWAEKEQFFDSLPRDVGMIIREYFGSGLYDLLQSLFLDKAANYYKLYGNFN